MYGEVGGIKEKVSRCTVICAAYVCLFIYFVNEEACQWCQ